MAKAKNTIRLDIPVADPSKPRLNVELLRAEAAQFAKEEFVHKEPSIFGSDNGKALGTYLEQKFTTRLASKFFVHVGNSASGIDLPEMNVDIKTTFVSQPQSSCPFSTAGQKIFGLGYSLLVFVYEKHDDADSKTATLDVRHTVFVEKERTADYTMTKNIREILADKDSTREEKADDLRALLQDKGLPGDEIEHNRLVDRVLAKAPKQGYLTISNALQWRLQYARVITQAGSVSGIFKVV